MVLSVFVEVVRRYCTVVEGTVVSMKTWTSAAHMIDEVLPKP